MAVFQVLNTSLAASEPNSLLWALAQVKTGDEIALSDGLEFFISGKLAFDTAITVTGQAQIHAGELLLSRNIVFSETLQLFAPCVVTAGNRKLSILGTLQVNGGAFAYRAENVANTLRTGKSTRLILSGGATSTLLQTTYGNFDILSGLFQLNCDNGTLWDCTTLTGGDLAGTFSGSATQSISGFQAQSSFLLNALSGNVNVSGQKECTGFSVGNASLANPATLKLGVLSGSLVFSGKRACRGAYVFAKQQDSGIRSAQCSITQLTETGEIACRSQSGTVDGFEVVAVAYDSTATATLDCGKLYGKISMQGSGAVTGFTANAASENGDAYTQIHIATLAGEIHIQSESASASAFSVVNSYAYYDTLRGGLTAQFVVESWSGNVSVAGATHASGITLSNLYKEVENADTALLQIHDWSGTLAVTGGQSALGLEAVHMELDDFSGTLLVSAPNQQAVAIRSAGAKQFTIHGTIAAGDFASIDHASDAITQQRITTAIKHAANGVAIADSGNSNDTITLAKNALILGDLQLSGGINTLTLDSEALAIGNLSGENLSIVYELNVAQSQAIVQSSNLEAWGNAAITLHCNHSGEYILATGSMAESTLREKVFTIRFEEREYTMRLGDAISSDQIELSWENQQMKVCVGQNVKNLQSTVSQLSWDAFEGATWYTVELSTDHFSTVVTQTITGTQLDLFALAAGSYQWRVKADQTDIWSWGDEITVVETAAGSTLWNSSSNGQNDLFGARIDGTWSTYYSAQHNGILENWDGVDLSVNLAGFNRLTDIFQGSTDTNRLYLTDQGQGDALFLDDIYSQIPDVWGDSPQARLSQIHEIFAGDGNDLIDLTSQRFAYEGDGVIFHGGNGNDSLWSNGGNNVLFGDDGKDVLVGGNEADILVGGRGDDVLYGGGGADIFTYGMYLWGNDVIRQETGGDVTLWFETGIAQDDLTITKLKNGSTRINSAYGTIDLEGLSLDKIHLYQGSTSEPTEYERLHQLGCFQEQSSSSCWISSGSAGEI